MKKNVKNILLGSLSVIGAGTILGIGLSTIEFQDKEITAKKLDSESSNKALPVENATNFADYSFARLGWETKTTITEADWAAQAPNVQFIHAGTFSKSIATRIELPKTLWDIMDMTAPNLTSLTFGEPAQATFDRLNTGFINNFANKIKTITLPSSIKQINPNALVGGFSEGIIFPTGSALTMIKRSAFKNTRATSIVLPNNELLEIEADAFTGTSFENVSAPIHLKSSPNKPWGLPASVFDAITWLAPDMPSTETTITPALLFEKGWLSKIHITLEDWKNDFPNATHLANQLFVGVNARKIWIPSTIVSLGNGMFSPDSEVEEVILPNETKLDTIPSNVFKGTKLSRFDVPDNIVNIGIDAFDGLMRLKQINFNKTSKLISVGNGAFRSTAISVFNAPTTLETLGDDAFYYTPFLNNITLPFRLKHPTKRYGLVSDQYNKIKWAYPSFSGSTLLAEDVVNMGWNDKTTILLSDFIAQAPNVTAIGDNAFKDNKKTNYIAIPDMVETIGVSAFQGTILATAIDFSPTSQLKTIGNWAFKSAISTDIIIPASVEKIGDGVFEGADTRVSFADKSNLKDIGSRAFSGSTITKIIIPESVASIANDAFEGTSLLTDISLDIKFKQATPQFGLTASQWASVVWRAGISTETVITAEVIASLGLETKTEFSLADWQKYMPNATEIRGAFKNNTFITTMHIPAGITIINDDSFMNTTKLKFINFHGNALTKLGVQAFRNSAITSLELPDNIVEVGPFAFAAMPSLTSVKLPARLKNIPNGMFELDMKLNNVIWPDELISIGINAFSKTSLTKIDLPMTVTSIADNAFANTVTTDISLPSRFKSPDAKFGFRQSQWNAVIWKKSPNLATQITKEIISEVGFDSMEIITLDDWNTWLPNANEIMPDAFMGNKILKSIQIPDPIKHIGSNAFANATNLSSVTFGTNSKLEILAAEVFKGSGITSFIMPNTVTQTGIGVFQNTLKLMTVKFSSSPLMNTIHHNTFWNSGLKEFEIPTNITIIGQNAFALTKLEKIIIGDQITTISVNTFTGTTLLKDITMPVKHKEPIAQFGFTEEQWASVKWIGSINLTDIINSAFGVNGFGRGENQDIVNQPLWSVYDRTTKTPEAREAGLTLEFSMGKAGAELVPWGTAAEFKARINELIRSQDILTTDMEIWTRMVIPGATGPDEDTLGGVKYTWSRGAWCIYSTPKGVWLDNFFFIDGSSTKVPVGTKIFSMARIPSDWYADIVVEGKSLSDVKIKTSFDFAYFDARGISLQVMAPGATDWKILTLGNINDSYNAGLEQFAFRLVITNTTLHRMFVETNKPITSSSIQVVVPIGKHELIIDPNQLSLYANVALSQNTHLLRALEHNGTFASNLSLEETKRVVNVDYSPDGITWYDSRPFGNYMKSLRGDALNNVDLSKFQLRYSFTDYGKENYFSTNVFGNADYVETIIHAHTSHVTKALDLTSFVEKASLVQAIGTTSAIEWKNLLDTTALAALGIEVEWNYWTLSDTNKIERSGWVNARPSSVAILKNPVALEEYPIAIRFVKYDEPGVPSNFAVFAFPTSTAVQVDIVKGYGVDVTGLGEVVELRETWGANYKVSGITGNVTTMVVAPYHDLVGDIALEKLEMQFGIGTSVDSLILPWANQATFQREIELYNETKDILKPELNIFARLILKGGTGTGSDIIGDIKYVWDKTVVEIYNNESGLSPLYGEGVPGTKLRALSRIPADWASSLSAEGKKASEVKILSKDNAFDIAAYRARGIFLEVSVGTEIGGTEHVWSTINEFGVDVFNAELTKQIFYRLSIKSSAEYEMYGGSHVDTTTPITGIQTLVIEKDVIAKLPWEGTPSSALATDLIKISGTTHQLTIVESDQLYTSSGLPLAEAKTFLEIQYSFNGVDFFTRELFIDALNKLRTTELNNLNFGAFRVKYMFTDLGLTKYYSPQIANDPEANELAVRTPITSGIVKTIDLQDFITHLWDTKLSGETTDIKYTNEIDTAVLATLGVKIQWSYWTTDASNNVVRSAWVDEKPTSIAMLKNPADLSVHPIAVRFVKIDEANMSIELKRILKNVSSNTDTVKGYTPDVTGLNEIITFTEELGTNYKVSGITGNIISMNIVEERTAVSSGATEKLEMQFSMGADSTSPIIAWSNIATFKTAIAAFNETADILRPDMNIYMKLILKGGTGPDSNLIDDIKYVWDNRVVEIYNNEGGVNGLFNEVDGEGSFLRAYARISDNWAESLLAGGKKSSEVVVTSHLDAFDIEYFATRGISLQASVDGLAWRNISAFGVDIFDASVTHKMHFRLNIENLMNYEMYGTDVATTVPTGSSTNVTIKDVSAKVLLSGVVSSDLITDKLGVTGTTHDIIINEADELYTVSGLSIVEAKKIFEIKYSVDGIAYLNKDGFTAWIKTLSKLELNDLNLANFKVKYEFTLDGLEKYYSSEISNDPDALLSNTIKSLNTSKLAKTIDLNEFITKAGAVKLSGTTLDIKYADELNALHLQNLGVKIQWNYWTLDASNNVVRSAWVDEKPTAVAMLKNPADLSVFPIAIRFVKIDETDTTIDLKNIVENVANDIDIVKGYSPDLTGLNEIIEFAEKLGTNYQVSGIFGNVLSMTAKEEQISVSAMAAEKLELQFAIGTNNTTLTIPWSNAVDFKTAIAKLYETQDILKTELNIYMKLILKGGTGPDSNIIDDIKYVWDNRVVEIYNNVTGVNAEFDTTDTAGSKLRAYSKIVDDWALPLSAEGKKSSEVKIINKDNAFDIAYYEARGISLEVSVDGAIWTSIAEFGVDSFDASKTNTMSFRLGIKNTEEYEMYGTDVPTTIPTGTWTNTTVKDVIAKVLLPGVVASDLTTNKISVTGSTNNLVITEADELYTVSGLPIAEAKTFFEIKYSFNGTDYLAKEAFINALNKLRTIELNNLDLTTFKVVYTFTDAGLAKYYSSEVFNDTEADPANTVKALNTSAVVKTIDLNDYVISAWNVKLSGTSLDIKYADEIDAIALGALGVKIQWSYWTKDSTNNIVRSAWVDEKPTAVAMLKNPVNPAGLHPIAIRFVKVDEANMSIELKRILEDVAQELDTEKGYAPNITGLNEVIEFAEKLGTNYQVSGIFGNVVSMTAKEEQISVSAMPAEKLEMQFSIGQNEATLTIPWSNAVAFKAAILKLNETQDILKTELNIYMKLILKGGTGPDSNIIDDIKYVWDSRVVEVYNNVTGVNAEFDTTDTAGSKLRAYSRISDNWADSLLAEGNKSSSVTVTSVGNVFDIRYFTARGIKLEANVDATNDATWTLIEEFGATTFDASKTNKMSYRLSVIDNVEYEIYGTTVATTTPSGTKTEIITKDIVAKIALTGVEAINLVDPTKLVVAGSTNSITITEADELYTISGMSLEEAKTFFVIKYSFDGTNYSEKANFELLLSGLRSTELNNLDLATFKVRYEFTEAGLAKYYSPEIFNDPEANPNTIKDLDTTNVIKTLDLNDYVNAAAVVKLSGTTLDIKYADEIDTATLAILGVKIQWSYWTKDSANNIVRSAWVDEKPTAVAMLKNPVNPEGLHPIAIRFVKIDEANEKIELKTIIDNVVGNPDMVKGYAPDITGLNEVIEMSEILGVNYKVAGIAGNPVSMTILEEQIGVSDIAKEKFEMQFAIGNLSSNLTIEWANAAAFKDAIATFNESNDILKSQLNIFVRLVLIGGTGPSLDIIGDTRYIWDKRVVEVYNNETGVNAEFDTTDAAGSKLRAYARINDNWADSLFAEGIKSNAVFIQSQDNAFDIGYFTVRGVTLQVSVNGLDNWLNITEFGTLPIDASETNKMSFRLMVLEPNLYEIHGATVAATTPVGTETNIIEKDIIAKIELLNVVASDLITEKLTISGTTHDFVITEADELYTISGMTLVEAKKYFEIKYTYDNTDYFTKSEFTKKLNDLRGLALNSIDLSLFKARYEFTEAGLAKYYSIEIFNDPEASPENTIKALNTLEIIKSIDVTKEIASIDSIELTGTTEALTWSGMGLISAISAFVTVEYGTYVKTETGEIVYVWSTERPTSIYTKTAPDGQVNYPVAIRFIPKLPTDKVEIGTIAATTSAPLVPVDVTLGYSVDTSKITTIINIDTTELVNKLILKGRVDFLNGGVASDVIEQDSIALVDAIYQKDVKLNYEISINPGTWYSLDGLREYMLNYSKQYSNENSGIMIFDNGVIPGVQITAKFVSKIADAFIINATPDAQTLLKTDQLKTHIDLREYVKVLETVKVIPSGTSSADVGTLLIPGMTPGNVLFGGKTFLEIVNILKSSIQMEFKAPGFHGDGWVSLDKITAVNFNNDLFIRFVVKTGAETNIELSLVGENDYATHLETGFKLPIALPKEIQVNSADLINLISLSGDTKNLVIDDSKVYADLIAKDPIYEGKVKILYTIGTLPIHLDPANPTKTEFTKDELINLLTLNLLDISLVQKQITAKYALADGISPDDFIIKDEATVKLIVENVLLFINKSNYYALASKLKVSGTSSAIVWGPEISDLKNALSEGLIIQYSTDPTALATDPTEDVKWSTTQPTTISPSDKFLAIRLVTKAGYIFEEEIKLFAVDTSNVLLIIALQKLWMQDILVSGNTRNIVIDTTSFETILATQEVPGREFLIMQYNFGGIAPEGLGIESTVEWFTAAQIKTIFESLKGSKNSKELILFRDSLKVRYSLSDEGFADYRLNIDGVNSDEQAPSKTEFYESLVTATINPGFNGYINLDLINSFISDSFKIVGSDEAPILEAGNSISEMLDFYKDPTIAPFDIYYTNIEGDFSNKEYKLFGEAGFIREFHPSFKILLDNVGNAKPIYFKIEARSGYQIWEANKLLNNGKIITITNIVVEKQIRNPLTTAPDIKFNAEDGSGFYQGEGSFSVYVQGTTTIVDQTFLNATHADIVPAVLKLEYNVSELEYTPEELEEIKVDKTKWVDVVPTNLLVGQFVMARVAINNDKFTLLGGDTITPQVRVKGLMVHADQLSIDPVLKLTNTDHYGYDALDGQTRIEEARLLADPLGNYLGADLVMSVETEFYRSTTGQILIDTNGIPIVKRNSEGATQDGFYKDGLGNNLLDETGNPIPIWTIERGGRVIPAPPLSSNNWQTDLRMNDGSLLGSFSQEDTSAQWKLFDGQFVRFTFIPRVGQGVVGNPDFVFDSSLATVQKVQLTNIKYPVQTNGIQYDFIQDQLNDIVYTSDDGEELPYTGSAHVSSQLTMVRRDEKGETIVSGEEITKGIAADFEGKVEINMFLNRKNGSPQSASGVNISQFKGLQNGDIITISFKSADDIFLLPKPIEPLVIIVKDLYVKPLNDDLFKYLRPNFVGVLNGSGSFDVRVTDPANPTDTNEAVLGVNQWYEYQVWNDDKTLKTGWTRDETKINNLENGDKVEWKIINKDGIFDEDYYNTLLDSSNTPGEEISFRVVNVIDNIEATVQTGIGSSATINPDVAGMPQYPENSGWIVSGLKVEITLEPAQQLRFEEQLRKMTISFNGVDKFGSMQTSQDNSENDSEYVELVWYTSSQGGTPRKITNFHEAGLSNGDEVWSSIAPTLLAEQSGLIIDESISALESDRFVVEGLTVIVNSSTQTLMIALITSSSVLFIGLVGLMIFVKRNKKLNNNKGFKK